MAKAVFHAYHFHVVLQQEILKVFRGSTTYINGGSFQELTPPYLSVVSAAISKLDYGLWIMDNVLWIMDYGLRITEGGIYPPS